MTGKRYSAGAIFLQVVPVFANVQKAIADEAKEIDKSLGDSMEKSGERAGERAGKAAAKKIREEVDKGGRDLSGSFEREFHKNIDSINSALNGIDTKRLGNNLRREVTQIKKELASLKDVDVAAEGDFRKVNADIAVLEGRLRGLRDEAKIIFRSDIDQALKGFGKIAAAKEAIDDPVEIKVSADFRVAERQMSSFEKSFKKTTDKAAGYLSGSMSKEAKKLKDELKYLENLQIGVDVSSSMARRELNEILDDLKRLQREDPNIDVKVDTARAIAEISAFEAALAIIEKNDIDIDVDVDTSRAHRSLRSLTGSGDDAANSFRSFNVVLLAVAGAGPALVPVLAAIAGGLLAIGPAAAVAAGGLGSVLVGFSGLGDALGALGARQDAQASNAQAAAQKNRSASYAIADAVDAVADAERNAARAAEDAARRVADAREAAADAVEDAIERQREAQERYKDSVDNVREAEKALREARREAADDGEDLERSIRENKLALDQALLDSFNATVTFNGVQSDGSATNAEKEQARINREEALLRLDELKAEESDLAKAKKKWDKEGVNGTDEVKSAQDRLVDAIDAQKNAYKDLQDAAKAVDEARADGARMVRDALQDQNRTLADSARSIADAQENLRRARESAAETTSAITAEQEAVNDAFSKLGPAGRKFALFLFSLREGFHAFRDAVQSAMLPAIQEAMEGFIGSANAGTARTALIGLAASFGEIAKALSVSLQGEAWGSFFGMLADLGPEIQEAYGGAFIKFMEAMASIMTTLAPFALQFAEGFERLMTSFANWAASESGAAGLTRFMEHVAEVAPSVLEFIGVFAKALTNIMVALAPYGEVILGLLTSMLDFIANLDPKILGAFVTGLLVLITASQIAYSVMNLLKAGAALFASTIGLWIFALVGVGLALAYLYKTNETFRDFINAAWSSIAETLSWAWEEHIKPALMSLWEAVEQLWNEVLAPFFAWLGPIVLWVAQTLFKILAIAFGVTVKAIATLIKYVLIPLFKLIGIVAKWLWKYVLVPIFNGILWAWEKLVDGMVWAWEKVLEPTFKAILIGAKWLWKGAKVVFDFLSDGWENTMEAMAWFWEKVLAPVFEFIREKALPKLEGAFENAIDGIKKIWEGLKKIVGAPVRFVIDTVLNGGLIDGFNKVANWVNMSPVKHIPIPSGLSFATGGIMPGYTPGRDVHSFVSPTAGRLDLSGGEAVMRPEWTAAMGTDYVNEMNALARRGGVKAVRQAALGRAGYWMGGVLPLPGGSVSSHGNSYGHPAFDLNYPGYADYGAAVKAYRDGIVAQLRYIGDASYGRWAVLNHAGGQNSLYAHLSRFANIGVGDRVSAGQTIGYVGDIGNTGTPPTSHLHFEIRGGSVDYNDTGDGGGKKGKPARKAPSWLMGIAKNPLGAVKDWITEPWSKASSLIQESPAFDYVKRVPLMAAEKVTDKVWDVVPGWVKSAAGWAGNAADWAVGGVKNALGAAADAASGVAGGVRDGAGAVGDFLGLAEGGILPYNGTMKYDNGGLLPPGLTSVLNLTGRPEPVFTADQWDQFHGAPGQGGNIHYEPHFEGSNLTTEDVAADLNFTFRKITRGGKYTGVGAS